MDKHSAFKMFLAHLLSQPDFRKYLEDTIGGGDVPVKIVMSDGSGGLKALDIQSILQNLVKHSEQTSPLDMIEELSPASTEEQHKRALIGLLALFLNGELQNFDGQPGSSPVSLRESIDNEWPW